ncbi:MAG: DUF2066 domain-containing protein [Alphaproteobacteria bacterium]|nr:DUF2066 domain-containing protein [Alphaproteobacteria bacterium]
MQKLLLLCLAVLCFAAPAAAQNNDLYSAEIMVDVTAENASVAREKAMNEANRKAFLAVAGRFTTSSGVEALSSLSNAQILNFIKEVSILSEKVSDVRYIADLKVAINENIFKTYMREKNISFAVGSDANILIIPTFREFSGDTPLLWEEGNLWRKAWEEKPYQQGQIKISPLPSTEENMSVMTAERALSQDGIALDKIARINGTTDIYTADAVYNGIEGLTVTLRSAKKGTEETINVSGERSPQLFEDAITEITARINNTIKQQDIADSQQKSEITVLYKYNAIRDWLSLEKTLKSIAIVDAISIDAIGSGKVQFKIHYVGNEDKLQRAVRDKYYNLRSFGSFYNIEKI